MMGVTTGRRIEDGEDDCCGARFLRILPNRPEGCSGSGDVGGVEAAEEASLDESVGVVGSDTTGLERSISPKYFCASSTASA